MEKGLEGLAVERRGRKSMGRLKKLPSKVKITLIYHENKGWYGYRRITAELHNRGFSCNHKNAQRLMMKELGLVCRVRIKKYQSYKGVVCKNCS